MQVTIRSMSMEDTQVIGLLSKQLGYSISAADTAANIQRLLSSNENCCLVAVHQSTVIGWIHGFVAYRIESNPFVEIGGLVVDENFRGRGVGKALIAQVKKWSLEQGVTTLRLRSNAKRKEAHAFYTKLGFDIIKEQKVFERRLHEL